MANSIFLEWENNEGNRTTGIFPLLEDPVIELASSFTSMADLIPGSIMNLINLMDKFSRSGGTAGTWTTDVKQLPLWERTEPLKLTTKLLFYTKTDPEADVWQPMQDIAKNPILRITPGGGYKTPGISFATYGKVKKAAKQKSQNRTSSISAAGKPLDLGINYVSLEIPGIVYLPVALVTSAKPTYSKEITESAYPLWGSLDVEIRSILPANNKMLEDSSIVAQTERFFNPSEPSFIFEG